MVLMVFDLVPLGDGRVSALPASKNAWHPWGDEDDDPDVSCWSSREAFAPRQRWGSDVSLVLLVP